MSSLGRATMITASLDCASAPRFRTEVPLESGHGDVVDARILATAHGIMHAWVGGHLVNRSVLSPGWSAYEWRLRYTTDDVTAAVRGAAATGSSVVVAALVGNGWYVGRVGFLGGRQTYGSRRAAMLQVEIRFADGHVQVIGTDRSWSWSESDVVFDDLFDGQTVDARLSDTSWLSPGGGQGFRPVDTLPCDRSTLQPYVGPRVVRHETLRPTRIWTSPLGSTLVDFGQNIAGWTRLRARGSSGRMITVRHAEVLENGELCTRPLRTAAATDRFILSGGDDVFEPTFTFHGFRYAEIEGYPGDLTPDDVQAVVVHSEMERIGWFTCSDPMLQKLHDNVVWSLRGNSVDIPSDCPQRDERLGWTGDIAVFAPTAAFLYDVQNFLGDWLIDLDLEQRAAGGVVPYVVPDSIKYDTGLEVFPPSAVTAIWSDAAVWVPWALYRAYGDPEALARAYGAMVAHARRVAALLDGDDLWTGGFQFGDWLDPAAPADDPIRSRADSDVVATACAVRTFGEVAAAAAVLGHTSDEAEFTRLGGRTRAAFLTHYVQKDGTIRSDCPTVYALPLAFGILDGDAARRAGDRLAELVRENGYHVATGFAGTPYVLDALSLTGHIDDAYRLLTERSCPSWLYPVTMGATTIWERWDSLLPDGNVNPGGMTSFNHYALGSVADWMHRVLGGLTPLEPGYSRASFAPKIGPGVEAVSLALRTPHGLLSTSWHVHDGRAEVEVHVPAGVELDIAVGSLRTTVGAGQHTWDVAMSSIQPPAGRTPPAGRAVGTSPG